MYEGVENLLSQMTLREKVSLLAGTNDWYTVPVERLGIPSLKMTDGPNGARGAGGFTSGVKAACFPAEISLASTWNIDLLERVGQALAREAHMKGSQVLLAPTVNIQRSPLGGRNFECFSEDPYLTARLAVAYINGLQREGVGASIKHYVCNDQEFERFSISSEVRERMLREIYLRPFEAAVREARPWTIMAAYNLVNGIPASESPYLLTGILREEWGFDGVVVSDWFESVKSTAASVNAGLDLEMPDPRWRGEKLLAAVERGEVAEATIDTSVSRLLQLLAKAGLFERTEQVPEQAIDLPGHRALIREAGAEGIVLLKNERNLLPLQREHFTSLAMIGPNAQVAQIMGGGSAQVNAHYAVTPFDGVMTKVGDHMTVRYEQGCTNYKLLPLLESVLLLSGTEGTEHGFAVDFFNTPDLSGAPVHREIQPKSELTWFGEMPAGVNPQQFSLRATGRFTPPRDRGLYLWTDQRGTQPLVHRRARGDRELGAADPWWRILWFREYGGPGGCAPGGRARVSPHARICQVRGSAPGCCPPGVPPTCTCRCYRACGSAGGGLECGHRLCRLWWRMAKRRL